MAHWNSPHCFAERLHNEGRRIDPDEWLNFFQTFFPFSLDASCSPYSTYTSTVKFFTHVFFTEAASSSTTTVLDCGSFTFGFERVSPRKSVKSREHYSSCSDSLGSSQQLYSPLKTVNLHYLTNPRCRLH